MRDDHCRREAHVWPKLMLVASFRSLLNHGRYCSLWCHRERRMRSRHGRVIPRKRLATFGLRETFFDRGFPIVTPYWLRIDVPRGCISETPWLSSNFAREFLDQRWEYWHVANTECAAYVASFILSQVYDLYRIWALNIDIIRNFRALDFPRVFRSERNAAELRAILEFVESTNFSSLSLAWRFRGEHQSL